MTDTKLVEFFCILDEFSKYFTPELKKVTTQVVLVYIVFVFSKKILQNKLPTHTLQARCGTFTSPQFLFPPLSSSFILQK